MTEPVVCSRWVTQALTARGHLTFPLRLPCLLSLFLQEKYRRSYPLRSPGRRIVRVSPRVFTITNCIDFCPLCYLQRIGKIGDIRRFVYQWITIFFRAFVPLVGIARARCPPKFADVFRTYIAAHRGERYRGGYRIAGRPAMWLGPIQGRGNICSFHKLVMRGYR